MNSLFRCFFNVLIIFLIVACNTEKPKPKPNVILIMVDDMGYECLSTYGSISYKTPALDDLASQGIKFNNCVSQPLCTPSRVKIMTGKYNYKNYDYFGHLKTSEFTFGNLMKDAGYATCIAGKWQLNGLSNKDKISDWNDNSKPNKLGFDEYCLWQLTQLGSRFADPLIEQNGKFLEGNVDSYGPDIFSNYILDFIERKKNQPFFVYYPMVLVHDPFVPTPDSKDWSNKNLRHKSNPKYFKDMVAYTDKIVGKIISKLKELKIDDNTIVLFIGDNGTFKKILSKMKGREVRGGKGKTTDAGTHVPFIASWPKKIKKGKEVNSLIEFSDFFATLADISNNRIKSDGKSFYSLLEGKPFKPRNTAFVHYDPRWSVRVNKHRNQFVRTEDYKLYQDGSFYYLKNDLLEKKPLQKNKMTKKDLKIKSLLELELKNHPKFK